MVFAVIDPVLQSFVLGSSQHSSADDLRFRICTVLVMYLYSATIRQHQNKKKITPGCV